MNTSNELPWSEKVEYLTKLSHHLKLSGYSSKEIYECIRGAVIHYEEIVKKVERGDIPSLHRSKEEIIQTKKAKGGLIASS